jgi:quercetin dioxygenase-like cupin family protein
MNAPLSTPVLWRAHSAPALPVFGVTVEVLLSGDESAGTMAVYRVTAPPGAGAPKHRHVGQDEAFHVLKGRFEIVCDDQVHQLEAGDFTFAPRGAVHAFTAIGSGEAQMVVFSTPAGHERFFRDCAAAVADGTFSPAVGQAICERHGIELIGAPVSPG